ncbi:arsenate reductase ArsC [soil metagenome]
MKNILVLCTGNSCRSQMAHGYLEKFAGEKAKVFSAGIEAHGVNPKAVQVMKEDDIDINHHTSDKLTDYLHQPFDYVITVCDNAKENCPWFPSTARKFHKNFADPAKATGSEEEIMNAFTSVRDEIKTYCIKFVAEHVN